MIKDKEIILGHGDLRISSLRCNSKGVVSIKEQPKHDVWERVDNPKTAEECMDQANINFVIDNICGAEVLVSKILEAMLYHQNKDTVAELVKNNENKGYPEFDGVLTDFLRYYSFNSTITEDWQRVVNSKYVDIIEQEKEWR